MAAVAVTAELVYRDGQKEKVSIKVENSLSSLISGIRELNTNVSRLLSELVEQEKAHGVSPEGDEDDDDDEDEDEEPEEPPKTEMQPPAKRSKTRST